MQLCQKQHLEKKITLTADVFLILRTPKNIVKQISKKSTFRGPFEKQMLRGTKCSGNLNDTTFSIFIDYCEDSSVEKFLS